MAEKRMQMTHLQVIALGNALAQAYDDNLGLYKLGADGERWTDATLAAAQPFTINSRVVERLRIQMFGEMKVVAEADPLEARFLAIEAQLPRFIALEARLARLERELGTANLDQLFSAQESTK